MKNHVSYKKDAQIKIPAKIIGYICPMRCEDYKTYEKPGNCPECGMHLQKYRFDEPNAQPL